MHISGLSHVALTVTDLTVARGFWTEVMGFEVAVDAPSLLILVDPPAQVVIACVEHDGGDGGPFDERRVGLDHPALQVDDIEQLRRWEARLIEAGRPASEIVESQWGSHLNVRGPDNLAIELLTMHGPVRDALFGTDGTIRERLQALAG